MGAVKHEGLWLDWCSYEAAKYAVEHWHYSGTMPKSKLVHIGVWENGEFKGVVLFGVGANSDLGRPYGLAKTECCELVRVALREHDAMVSRIVAVAVAKLKRAQRGLRLIVSFADPEQGHLGIIYQAGNWVYTGRSTASDEYIIGGKRWHGRSLRNGKPGHLTTREYARDLPALSVGQGSSNTATLMLSTTCMRKQIEPRPSLPEGARTMSVRQQRYRHVPGRRCRPGARSTIVSKCRFRSSHVRLRAAHETRS